MIQRLILLSLALLGIGIASCSMNINTPLVKLYSNQSRSTQDEAQLDNKSQLGQLLARVRQNSIYTPGLAKLGSYTRPLLVVDTTETIGLFDVLEGKLVHAVPIKTTNKYYVYVTEGTLMVIQSRISSDKNQHKGSGRNWARKYHKEVEEKEFDVYVCHETGIYEAILSYVEPSDEDEPMETESELSIDCGGDNDQDRKEGFQYLLNAIFDKDLKSFCNLKGLHEKYSLPLAWTRITEFKEKLSREFNDLKYTPLNGYGLTSCTSLKLYSTEQYLHFVNGLRLNNLDYFLRAHHIRWYDQGQENVKDLDIISRRAHAFPPEKTKEIIFKQLGKWRMIACPESRMTRVIDTETGVFNQVVLQEGDHPCLCSKDLLCVYNVPKQRLFFYSCSTLKLRDYKVKHPPRVSPQTKVSKIEYNESGNYLVLNLNNSHYPETPHLVIPLQEELLSEHSTGVIDETQHIHGCTHFQPPVSCDNQMIWYNPEKGQIHIWQHRKESKSVETMMSRDGVEQSEAERYYNIEYPTCTYEESKDTSEKIPIKAVMPTAKTIVQANRFQDDQSLSNYLILLDNSDLVIYQRESTISMSKLQFLDTTRSKHKKMIAFWILPSEIFSKSEIKDGADTPSKDDGKTIIKEVETKRSEEIKTSAQLLWLTHDGKLICAPLSRIIEQATLDIDQEDELVTINLQLGERVKRAFFSVMQNNPRRLRLFIFKISAMMPEEFEVILEKSS